MERRRERESKRMERPGGAEGGVEHQVGVEQQRDRDPASNEELFISSLERESVASNYSSWRGTQSNVSERSMMSA